MKSWAALAPDRNADQGKPHMAILVEKNTKVVTGSPRATMKAVRG